MRQSALAQPPAPQPQLHVEAVGHQTVVGLPQRQLGLGPHVIWGTQVGQCGDISFLREPVGEHIMDLLTDQQQSAPLGTRLWWRQCERPVEVDQRFGIGKPAAASSPAKAA